jgi:hypothetical protein
LFDDEVVWVIDAIKNLTVQFTPNCPEDTAVLHFKLYNVYDDEMSLTNSFAYEPPSLA